MTPMPSFLYDVCIFLIFTKERYIKQRHGERGEGWYIGRWDERHIGARLGVRV